MNITYHTPHLVQENWENGALVSPHKTLILNSLKNKPNDLSAVRRLISKDLEGK